MGSRVTTATAAFNAGVFERETSWEFTARSHDSVTLVEVLTPSVTTLQLRSAISAHDPDRYLRARLSERSAAVAVLSQTTQGRATLTLLGLL